MMSYFLSDSEPVVSEPVLPFFFLPDFLFPDFPVWSGVPEPDWPDPAAPAVRRHDAFLNSFAPEDEGLYDDVAR